MIDAGVDKSGSALRTLIYGALKEYPTPALHPLLGDANHIVRTAVARELQTRGERESFHVAKHLLSKKKAHLREIGCFLLGQLGAPGCPYREESLPLLKAALSGDSSADVRSAAAAALGHLAASTEADTLLLAADDPNAKVRASIAFALTRLKQTRRIRGALLNLRSDDDERVRLMAGE